MPIQKLLGKNGYKFYLIPLKDGFDRLFKEVDNHGRSEIVKLTSQSATSPAP